MVLQKKKTVERLWKLKKQMQQYRHFAEKREEELNNIFEESFTLQQKKSALELVKEATQGEPSVTRAVICLAQIAENKELLRFIEEKDRLIIL
tara:strand:- start:1027 stop:1305 length:279 start_codon:yes stop_codon:yes gene_type:complete